MKKWIKDIVVCPHCLPEEFLLDLTIREIDGDDVLEGELTCPVCARHYPIGSGVAVLLADTSPPMPVTGSGYNSRSMLSAYLWSHFCDMFKDPQATSAYRVWSSFFRPNNGCALDIGCAVGRLSFELSTTHARVVGIDTSISFIQKARQLMRTRKLRFDLIVEGFMTEERACDFNTEWNCDRIDFIVADALALPFPRNFFATVTSINILEKVSHPLRHLLDVNRVLQDQQSMFVFSDPFSWDETTLDPKYWLGGVPSGEGCMRGIETVTRYLTGKDGVMNPPLEIVEHGKVDWKIRKTENLWEHITSQFVVGTRV